MLKYHNFEFFTHSIIHLQAIIPVIKAAVKPTNIVNEFICIGLVPISKKLLIMLPKIKGITIRKEKRAALDKNGTIRALSYHITDLN